MYTFRKAISANVSTSHHRPKQSCRIIGGFRRAPQAWRAQNEDGLGVKEVLSLARFALHWRKANMKGYFREGV